LLLKDVRIVVDFTLARGLDYYTGIIFEAKAPPSVSIGSIGGGGRYDDLTGLFGVPGIPGAGISFGLDRMYDVMETLSLFPASLNQSSQALFFHTGEDAIVHAYAILQQLRDRGIACELFPEAVKFDKQFKYAEKRNIPYAVIIGSKEVESRTLIVKNLEKGEQITYNWDALSQISFE
jgi:histidyl-tRNA synthetase